MEAAILVFLSSGLFLGWSLGANDAANVFGTAVGTRMVRFSTAALICSVFVIIGAVISGGGAAHTLGKLGAVNIIPGAFMVALAAALTVYAMTKAGLPVSTTQAIVGAIVGWNLFSESLTDTGTLVTLVSTWVLCPALAAAIAAGLFFLLTNLQQWLRLHLLRIDAYTRTLLILAGAFGAYSLGANNIANVMGVFVPVSPFTAFSLAGLFTVSSAQQLFALGGIAIAVGVFTYSKRVMMTVGRDLAPLSPVAAFVVVLSHSVVLFLFASQGLEHLLARAGLPTIPLVPVSSSQAVVGAVIGIGLLKGGRGISYRLLGSIAVGWVATPVIAGIVCFVALFFLQNVFNQEVYRPVTYELSEVVLARAADLGIDTGGLEALEGKRFQTAKRFTDALAVASNLRGRKRDQLVRLAEIDPLVIDTLEFDPGESAILSDAQVQAVARLAGRSFRYRWMFDDALAGLSEEWRGRPNTTVNKLYNRALEEQRQILYNQFRVPAAQ